MKTKIILKQGWTTIAEFDYLINLSKDDIVCSEDIEYKVDCLILELDKKEMIILLK